MAWFPSVYYNKMHTIVPFTISSAASAGAGLIKPCFIVRANDMFEGFSIVSVNTELQPQGYDEITPFFQNWQVLATKVELLCCQNATGSPAGFEANPVTVTARWSPQSGASSSIQQLLASRFSKSVTLMPYTSQTHRMKLTMYSKTAAVLSRPQSQNKDSFGTDGSGPNDVSFLHVTMFSVDGTDLERAVTIECHVTYWVKWFKPDNFASSSPSDMRGVIAVGP